MGVGRRRGYAGAMVSALLAFAFLGWLGAIAFMAVNAVRAPVGFEDEDGFHYQCQPIPAGARNAMLVMER